MSSAVIKSIRMILAFDECWWCVVDVDVDDTAVDVDDYDVVDVGKG